MTNQQIPFVLSEGQIVPKGGNEGETIWPKGSQKASKSVKMTRLSFFLFILLYFWSKPFLFEVGPKGRGFDKIIGFLIDKALNKVLSDVSKIRGVNSLELHMLKKGWGCKGKKGFSVFQQLVHNWNHTISILSRHIIIQPRRDSVVGPPIQ